MWLLLHKKQNNLTINIAKQVKQNLQFTGQISITPVLLQAMHLLDAMDLMLKRFKILGNSNNNKLYDTARIYIFYRILKLPLVTAGFKQVTNITPLHL